MSIPVVHPWDNIFFFKLAFINYSMQKYPLQAWQYEIDCIKFCFVYLQTVLDLSNVWWYLIADWMIHPISDEQRTLIGWADLNLFIDHAVKTKTNKMDCDLCVFKWT